MDFPFRRISPEVGMSKPAIMRSVVVLPQPDGPRKVTNSPRFTSRLKSCTAMKPLSSYWRITCLSSMMFSLFTVSFPIIISLYI